MLIINHKQIPVKGFLYFGIAVLKKQKRALTGEEGLLKGIRSNFIFLTGKPDNGQQHKALNLSTLGEFLR